MDITFQNRSTFYARGYFYLIPGRLIHSFASSPSLSCYIIIGLRKPCFRRIEHDMPSNADLVMPTYLPTYLPSYPPTWRPGMAKKLPPISGNTNNNLNYRWASGGDGWGMEVAVETEKTFLMYFRRISPFHLTSSLPEDEGRAKVVIVVFRMHVNIFHPRPPSSLIVVRGIR